MPSGYIYVLNSPGLAYVKIGRTTRSPLERASELYSTGTPFPFALAHSEPVSDVESAETEVHQLLAASRVNLNREFFNVTVAEAITVVQSIAQKYCNQRPASPKLFRVAWIRAEPPFHYYFDFHSLHYALRMGVTTLNCDQLLANWPERQKVFRFSPISTEVSDYWRNHFKYSDPVRDENDLESFNETSWGWYFERKTLNPYLCRTLNELLQLYKEHVSASDL